MKIMFKTPTAIQRPQKRRFMRCLSLALSILLPCGIVFLCGGCHKATVTPPITEGFSCRVVADYNDLAMVGTLQRPAAGTLILTLEQPSTLSGLTAHWDGKVLTARWHGLSIELDEDTVPKAAFIRKMAEILDTALGVLPEKIAETNGGVQLTGKVGQDTFTLISDPATGHLLSLSIPTLSLMVRFEEINII